MNYQHNIWVLHASWYNLFDRRLEMKQSYFSTQRDANEVGKAMKQYFLERQAYQFRVLKVVPHESTGKNDFGTPTIDELITRTAYNWGV